jgi:hypothetical protein
MEFYNEMSLKSILMPNEAEFRAYYILVFPWNNNTVSQLETELSLQVYFDPLVQLALEIRSLMTAKHIKKHPAVDGSINHFSRVFSILRRNTTSYLFACCVHLHFNSIRLNALKAIQKSYYSDTVEKGGMLLKDAIEMLGFDGEDAAEKFLKHYFIDLDKFNGLKIVY